MPTEGKPSAALVAALPTRLTRVVPPKTPPDRVLALIDPLGHSVTEGHPWGMLPAPTEHTLQTWTCRRCCRSAIETVDKVLGTATTERCDIPPA